MSATIWFLSVCNKLDQLNHILIIIFYFWLIIIENTAEKNKYRAISAAKLIGRQLKAISHH